MKQLGIFLAFDVYVEATSKAFLHVTGIIGSSIAMNLAKKGCKVTLLDAAPHAASAASKESWAWLNANRKAPDHYRGKGMDLLCCMINPLAHQRRRVAPQTFLHAPCSLRPPFKLLLSTCL